MGIENDNKGKTSASKNRRKIKIREIEIVNGERHQSR
jgi:hypothetical protein